MGDTARVPYGTKSRETVLKYSFQNAAFLVRHGVKAIVVACNTASAHGLLDLEKKLQIPVLGVIHPGAITAAQITCTKKVGVIGTEGTISSEAYSHVLKQLDPQIEVSSQSCPLLVGLAEEGLCDGEIVQLVLKKYLGTLKQIPSLDTLILGCTHYPLFKKEIAHMLGPGIQLVDSAVATAKALKDILTEKGLLAPFTQNGKVVFFSTDAPSRIKQIGHLFLGRPVTEVTQVDV